MEYEEIRMLCPVQTWHCCSWFCIRQRAAAASKRVRVLVFGLTAQTTGWIHLDAKLKIKLNEAMKIGA
jgi:hypothetical protein